MLNFCNISSICFLLAYRIPSKFADGVDYTPVVETVFFGPEEMSVMVTVPILDDVILEDDEVFTATLMSDRPNVIVDPDRGNAAVTILDNDREFNWQA